MHVPGVIISKPCGDLPMLYMFLLQIDPAAPQPENALERHFAFAERASKAKAYVYSEALQPPDTGITAYPPGAKKKTHDGPFAETKEMLGGFYVLDCEDKAEAVRYGEQLAAVIEGIVEIRPIFNVPGWPYTVGADRRDE